MKVESLAGTGKDYTALQAYTREEALHIQGSGENGNRDYGVAVDIPTDKFPSDLWDWLVWMTEEKGNIKSLADNSDVDCYFPIQVRVRADTLHFQVKGEHSFNREYGAAFDIPATAYPDLVAFAK